MKICPIAGIKIAKEGRLITLLNYKLNIHKLPNTFNLTKVVIFCQIWSHLAPGQKKSILKCNFFPRKDFSLNPEQNQFWGIGGIEKGSNLVLEMPVMMMMPF